MGPIWVTLFVTYCIQHFLSTQQSGMSPWLRKRYNEHQRVAMSIKTATWLIGSARKMCPTITACGCPGTITPSPPPACIPPGLWPHG